MGVFHWIRDGVRRSVLLGVSDAMTQMGTPDQGEELHPHLAAAIGNAPAIGHSNASSSVAALNAPAQPSRKRLGKSLSQIRQEGEAK